ncbi:unnamed protein product [Rotaria socialis]|uniref:Uncharacterized protein n=1 Tax=Rotaria socialis TaxID=392032 RepID=A0A821DVD5_9BILA|nr:unnamed protein product [Rotaria socialis]
MIHALPDGKFNFTLKILVLFEIENRTEKTNQKSKVSIIFHQTILTFILLMKKRIKNRSEKTTSKSN